MSDDHFYDVEIHHQDWVSFDWTSNDINEHDSSISDVSHAPHNSPQLENGRLYAEIDYQCDEDDYISVQNHALTFSVDYVPLFYIGEPDYCEFDYDDNCGCEVNCNCDDDDYCECESDCECTDASFGDWNFISQGDSISTDEKVLPGYRKLPIRVLDSEGVLSSVSKRKRKFIEDNSYNSLLMCFELTPQ